MSVELQHMLAVSLFVGYVSTVIVAATIVISKIMIVMTDKKYSFKRSLMVLWLPVVIVTSLFLLTYGYLTYENADKTIDNNGDIRFTISDDGLDIWSRRRN
jgi:uncharacterized membrane protein